MLCYVSALLRGPFRLLDPHTDRRLGVVRVKPDTPLLTTPLSSPFRSHSCDPTAASSLAGETSTSHLHDSRIFCSPTSTSSYSLLSKLTRAVFFPPPGRYPVNVSVESPPARSETSDSHPRVSYPFTTADHRADYCHPPDSSQLWHCSGSSFAVPVVY